MQITLIECEKCGCIWDMESDDYELQECSWCGWNAEDSLIAEFEDNWYDTDCKPQFMSEMSFNSSLLNLHNRINCQVRIAAVNRDGKKYINDLHCFGKEMPKEKETPKKKYSRDIRPRPEIAPVIKMGNIDRFLKEKPLPVKEKPAAKEKNITIDNYLSNYAAIPKTQLRTLSTKTIIREEGKKIDGRQYFLIERQGYFYHKYVCPDYTIVVKPIHNVGFSYEIFDNIDHFLMATSENLSTKDKKNLLSLPATELLLSEIVYLLDWAIEENNTYIKKQVLAGYTTL